MKLAPLEAVLPSLFVLAAPALGGSGTAEHPAARFIYIPPSIEGRVVYYHSFENDLRRPEINLSGLELLGGSGEPVEGFTSRGLRLSGGGLKLSSGTLSLSRPLTVMMWWRLGAPMREDSGYHLITLGGKGIVSAFVRGKGDWCALREPTFVFQVYYFEGIRNMNHIWSGNAWVERHSWHHFAITVTGAAEVCAYWDGRARVRHTIKGRPFAPDDLKHLELGSGEPALPMTIDELLILDRALTDDEIAEYVQATENLARLRLRAGN